LNLHQDHVTILDENLTIIADPSGLVFVFFGSNAFLHFLPTPPLPQGVTGEYLHAFFCQRLRLRHRRLPGDRRLAFADPVASFRWADDSRLPS
jgi:hypothetical protein